MTLDQIDRMVRQANPVPDLTVLEPVDASVLVFDQQRRTEMQTHDRVEVDQEQEKSGRGFLVGIAAAVVIVVGVLVLVRPMDAPVAASPIEVATAFVEAYAAGDADKTISYLAADADLSEFTQGVEGLRPSIRFDEATGFQRLFDSCVATGATPTGMSVRCTYDYHGIRSEEIGLGPYSGSWLDIAIEDGRIVSVSDDIVFMENGFSEQMWEPFAQWIGRTYPDDGAVMYLNWPNIFMAQLTDESIELWEERSIEYVAVVNGS